MRITHSLLLSSFACIATAAADSNLFFPDCDETCGQTFLGPRLDISFTDSNGDCQDACVFWLVAYFRLRRGWECGKCEPDIVEPGIKHILITGNYVAADFTVSEKPTSDPDSDGKVHGVLPSDGSVTFELRVDTRSLVGPFLPTDTSLDYPVEHPFYGYTDVSLPCGAEFGTASWVTAGILTTLEGPNDSKAALWVNKDLDGTAPPTLASFRMFGSGLGKKQPDLFVGGVTLYGKYVLRDSFLLWEYYNGEEIRNNDFSFAFGEICE